MNLLSPRQDPTRKGKPHKERWIISWTDFRESISANFNCRWLIPFRYPALNPRKSWGALQYTGEAAALGGVGAAGLRNSPGELVSWQWRWVVLWVWPCVFWVGGNWPPPEIHPLYQLAEWMRRWPRIQQPSWPAAHECLLQSPTGSLLVVPIRCSRHYHLLLMPPCVVDTLCSDHGCVCCWRMPRWTEQD